mmetsp:Transcript_9847/g.14419  ORF Transcript_9847/g.14419 Transcript_9847/m.14419 type:complete len:204 (-) Transcript_9847:188-799(-)|eukprot:CAMPEP_0195516704 /NCGR_PEP_ID=MMETSP0794_2-20130614/8291_1 /TAXON_ID=515487 /ORGANISM="Stephanopyxis turris, Strain CCMP 815" /LENGTH=203 /DNA_ID=CAMNT_0040645363 /DNA_START=270 /DNA_END=881 /DNA_ORIENTATION=-
MSTITADWDNDYSKLARSASQLRTTGSMQANLPMGSREGQMSSIRAGIDRLMGGLHHMEQARSLSPQEIARRKNLVENLSMQVNGANAAGGGTGSYSNQAEQQPAYRQSAAALALKQQDGMIDELALGVGRLKNQSHLIGEEARQHVKLLDEMDADVEKAHAGIEEETRRMEKIRQDSSVWRLYMIIVGLSVLLFFLIILGLS